MTAYLSLLVLLGLGASAPAAATQFDTFSVSGFIEPPSTTGFPVTEVHVSALAPGFSLSLGFHSQAFPGNTARIGCLSSGFDTQPIPCRPGDHVGAGAVTFGGLDAFASVLLPGQPIATPCTLSLRPVEGTLCASVNGAFIGWSASASLPPFIGAGPSDVPTDILNLTTVPGTFSANFGVSIWDSHLPGLPVRIDGIAFEGAGIAQFDLVWQPDTGTWLPLFAEGRLDVAATPEPATFLLCATMGAGLALIRQYRRLTDRRQHAGRDRLK